MLDLWNYLRVTDKPVFLYGTGNGADKILNELIKLNIPVSGVFASDGFVRNRFFRGFKVQSYSDVKLQFKNIIVLVAFGSYLPEVISNIKKIASETELFAPDVPVIPDGDIFNCQYVKKYKTELKTVYGMLADEQSKKVFENTVKFKLTGNIKYLFECETPRDEAYGILNLKNIKTYLDLGAYKGDTVAEFLKYADHYEKIIALEPDTKNCKKLILNTQNIKNITVLPAAVGDSDGEVMFKMSGGRNSAVSNSGTFIKQLCVDGFDIGADSYIKFDVEGAELSAISGAEKTLRFFKPKLNIAAYHKNSDIFSIPLKIKEINSEYKVYMRHHPYIPAWDTNYYFI